ncbi:hypothetical protein F4604DRAFT_1794014 [Suillus subluteus]|nr:hypothetical protein F4604DRAFT_1794014 [Suillus subluteus]
MSRPPLLIVFLPDSLTGIYLQCTRYPPRPYLPRFVSSLPLPVQILLLLSRGQPFNVSIDILAADALLYSFVRFIQASTILTMVSTRQSRP